MGQLKEQQGHLLGAHNRRFQTVCPCTMRYFILTAGDAMIGTSARVDSTGLAEAPSAPDGKVCDRTRARNVV